MRGKRKRSPRLGEGKGIQNTASEQISSSRVEAMTQRTGEGRRDGWREYKLIRTEGIKL